VGKEFNVTRERIRQIEAKALRKLRHPSRSRKLKDYLDYAWAGSGAGRGVAGEGVALRVAGASGAGPRRPAPRRRDPGGSGIVLV